LFIMRMIIQITETCMWLCDFAIYLLLTSYECVQSLCSLRHFRDKFLTEPLAWVPSVDNPCISQIFHEIFSAWEKNDYHLPAVLLTCVKIFLCGIVDGTSYYYKVYIC
jgi:hypothetical protein